MEYGGIGVEHGTLNGEVLGSNTDEVLGCVLEQDTLTPQY